MPLTAMFLGWLVFGTGIGLAQIPADLPRVPTAEATNWFNHKVVCYVKCYSCADSVEAAVVRGLSPYPVVRKPAPMSAFPGGTQRDEASGKPILVWTIKQISRNAGEVEVQVDCREHLLKGYGQAIRLRKIDGDWKVESCIANWLS